MFSNGKLHIPSPQVKDDVGVLVGAVPESLVGDVVGDWVRGFSHGGSMPQVTAEGQLQT